MVANPKGFDRRASTQDLRALVSRYHDLSGGRMALGLALLDLTRLAYRYRTPVPNTMTPLDKTMPNLDGTIRALSPELDPVQLIRGSTLRVMERRVGGQLRPGRSFAWVIDLKHLVEHGPRRADRVLAKLANDQLTLRVEVATLDRVLQGLDRAAGRIARGMAVGSPIVGGYGLGSAIQAGRPGRGPGR